MCAAALVGVLAAPAQARPSALPGPGPAADLASGSVAGLGWALKPTGTDARFRGLAAVDRSTAWVSGSHGTVLRTVDGGRSWGDVSPPGAAGLELRDIEAFDARRALALSIGEGPDSRVWRTEDGGASWTETFRNPDPRAFYDCMTFFDPAHGLAVSDPVDGKFRILSTADGGRSWRVLPNAGMPDALPGEAGFAASGQCLVSAGRNDVWLATGGGANARVLHSADRGLTWSAADSTVPAGDPAKGSSAWPSATAGTAWRWAATTGPARRPRGPGRSPPTRAVPGVRRARRRPPTARGGLGPVHRGGGPRGRTDRYGPHPRRGPQLAAAGHGFLRHGRLHRGPDVLGRG